MTVVSVCLPPDHLSQCLPSYLGFSYLGRSVSFYGCSSKVKLLLLTSAWCSSSLPWWSCAITAAALVWCLWLCTLKNEDLKMWLDRKRKTNTTWDHLHLESKIWHMTMFEHFFLVHTKYLLVKDKLSLSLGSSFCLKSCNKFKMTLQFGVNPYNKFQIA